MPGIESGTALRNVMLTLQVLRTDYVTHDVKRFILKKPPGFTFVPGQSGNFSIHAPGWEDKIRPFSFTNLPEDKHIELMIKIYRNKNGVTRELERTNAGSELILHSVFGTIEYKQRGVFIAAGSGITPFLSIFRNLFKKGKIHHNQLIYSNKTLKDVIQAEELKRMLGKNFIETFTRENVIGFIDRRIDRDFLIEHISNYKQHFYVCGPENFVNDLVAMLKDLGASTEFIIF